MNSYFNKTMIKVSSLEEKQRVIDLLIDLGFAKKPLHHLNNIHYNLVYINPEGYVSAHALDFDWDIITYDQFMEIILKISDPEDRKNTFDLSEI